MHIETSHDSSNFITMYISNHSTETLVPKIITFAWETAKN